MAWRSVAIGLGRKEGRKEGSRMVCRVELSGVGIQIHSQACGLFVNFAQVLKN